MNYKIHLGIFSHQFSILEFLVPGSKLRDMEILPKQLKGELIPL